MAMNKKRVLITSALPYTNGPVHIGHLAGAYLPADIYARYARMRYGNDNVLYICGSDEHGVPITIAAAREQLSPQDIVDRYHAIIKTSFDAIGISFDHYGRTSSPIHHQTASQFFRKMYDAGQFIEQESDQYYDETANQFLADRYITGTCPKCSNPNAYGDQCEKCGSTLNPNELINPHSNLSGAPLVLKKTTHWYFPLDQYQTWLEQWLIQDPYKNQHWRSHVMGQCKSWLDGGLQPRAITRDLDWGIKVPVEGAEGKVLYVWFDAPIGYISNTIEWCQNNGQDWQRWWCDEDTSLIHFIGKDNIVFHCLMFPAMLKAHGGYILPDNVPANQFLNLEGDKMSTSRGWTVWLNDFIADFPGYEDALRYYLTQNMPENKDSDFSWKEFQEKNNSELVANIGNFINRVLVLIDKFYDGQLPSYHHQVSLEPLSSAIIQAYKTISHNLEDYMFKSALQHIMQLSSVGNKFLADHEPWKKIKESPQAAADVLYGAAQLAAHLSIMMEPFLPFTAKKIQALFNVPVSNMHWYRADNTEQFNWLLEPNHKLCKPELLVAKIDDEAIALQLAKLQDKIATNNASQESVSGENVVLYNPVKELIQYDDFAKMDIRIGRILAAEPIPKANKLLKLTVDLGFEQRTIVSGIAEHFSPSEIVGNTVTVLCNLAPRMLRGVESNGMILMAEDTDGKLKFLQPHNDTQPGMSVS